MFGKLLAGVDKTKQGYGFTDLGRITMQDNWKSLGSITARIAGKIAPVTYEVPLDGTLAVRLSAYAIKEGVKPETIIAEAVRSYMGDAA